VDVINMPINAHKVRICGSLNAKLDRSHVRAYWQNNLNARHFAAGTNRLNECRYRPRRTYFCFHYFPLFKYCKEAARDSNRPASGV
jgi:hypothetical protein